MTVDKTITKARIKCKIDDKNDIIFYNTNALRTSNNKNI